MKPRDFESMEGSRSSLECFHETLVRQPGRCPTGIHEDSITKVAFIVRKHRPYRLAEFGRRKRIEMENFTTWIVSKEDLIISKLWWAKDSYSELQLRDVKNLAGTAGCDAAYIERWTREMGLFALWGECQP